jgi:cbb3-type cytochrome oxidase subunit 3
MFQEFFRGNEWLELPVIALVFFFVFFLAVVWRVAFRMRDTRKLHELASLPFADERRPEPRKESTHG